MFDKNSKRRMLLAIAEQLESLGKLFRGAADKVLPTRRIMLADCERQHWRNIRPPCFVLSTGRSGTLLLTRLLQLSPDAYPLHEPRPELFRTSRRAYEEIHRTPEIFREVFKSAREEYVLRAAQLDRVYIETNNQITFFAPVIADVFPGAPFLHLVRHPGDFVRSGIRRKWYEGSHSHEIGRIVPADKAGKTAWEGWSQIKKIGWLWNETNSFIEAFAQTLPDGRMMLVKSEDLFREADVAEAIFRFLNLTGYDRKRVGRVIGKPMNVQRKGHFPHFDEWSEADKTALARVTPLADKYGYTWT